MRLLRENMEASADSQRFALLPDARACPGKRPNDMRDPDSTRRATPLGPEMPMSPGWERVRTSIGGATHLDGDTNRDSAAHPSDSIPVPFRGLRNARLESRVCRPDLCFCWRCGGREGGVGRREVPGTAREPGVRGAEEGRGDGTADRARWALCREKVGGSTELAPTGQDQEEDGRARPPARIPRGPGLDVVRNLGVGKVGGVLVTGEEAARRLEGSALRSALTWLRDPVRGTWEGCGGHGVQGSGDPKPWTELLWRAPQDRVPQSQLMGQHRRTQPWTELLWRMPQDGVLRRLLICQNPHTRPHSQLWPLDLARKVPEPDSARRDSETASLPPAQSLPSSSDTEAAGTGRRCCHGGCWAWLRLLVRLESVFHQGSAHGLGVRLRRDQESVLHQDPASGKWAPPLPSPPPRM